MKSYKKEESPTNQVLVMANILTPRQTEIVTRFFDRQVLRVRNFNIPDYDEVRDHHVYHCHIFLSDGRTFEVNIIVNDEEEENAFFCTISLEKSGKRIHHKVIDGMRIVRTDLSDFLSELSKLTVCVSCDKFFKGEEGEEMKYCDACDPFITTHNEDCPICLTNKEGIWTKTPCNHYFHYECLNKVERVNSQDRYVIKCPMCRTEFTTIEKM